MQLHLVSGVIGVDEHIARAEVRRPRVAYAAIVDEANSANLALHWPMRMANADEVGVNFPQHFCKHFVRMLRMNPRSIVQPRRHMCQENARSVRQYCALFDRHSGDPVQPAGGCDGTLGPSEGVRYLHQARQQIRLGARILYGGVRSLAREEIAFGVSLDEHCIRQPRESLQGTDRIGADCHQVSQHPVRICSAASGDVRKNGVQGDAVAVDV